MVALDRHVCSRSVYPYVNESEPDFPLMRKKISTTIYVTPEQSDKLKLLHDRTKVPVAVYIREGIDLVLRHYAHLLPGQLALDVTPPAPAVSEEAPKRAPKARGSNTAVDGRSARAEAEALDADE